MDNELCACELEGLQRTFLVPEIVVHIPQILTNGYAQFYPFKVYNTYIMGRFKIACFGENIIGWQ